ncbi:hypothetical protein [Halarchaeum grantii]|uniref:hypothetical protein n=1 Tax=Halarchaeum grantii TaxID=1193105 RepID=UPI00166E2A9C|nr:hypothetical protein [Halarchaeum grantii]
MGALRRRLLVVVEGKKSVEGKFRLGREFGEFILNFVALNRIVGALDVFFSYCIDAVVAGKITGLVEALQCLARTPVFLCGLARHRAG